MPFFDIGQHSQAVLCSGALLYSSLITVAVCGFVSWALVFQCELPRQISPSSPDTPLKQKCAPGCEKAMVPFEMEKYINLVRSSCLKHANEMLLGDLRQADKRTQNFNFSTVISSISRSRRSRAKLLVFTCMNAVHFLALTSALEHLSRPTQAVLAITQCSQAQNATRRRSLLLTKCHSRTIHQALSCPVKFM